MGGGYCGVGGTVERQRIEMENGDIGTGESCGEKRVGKGGTDDNGVIVMASKRLKVM